jgi:hypothetical protein
VIAGLAAGGSAVEVHDAVVARLARVEWMAAPEWDGRAAGLLREYYRRLLPLWPADRVKVLPDDLVVLDRLLGRLSAADRSWSEQRARELAPPGDNTTRRLVAVVLAGALLQAAGALGPGADPGEPLLDLFEAGFALGRGHAAVDVLYSCGMTSVPLPSRSQLAAAPERRPSRQE